MSYLIVIHLSLKPGIYAASALLIAPLQRPEIVTACLAVAGPVSNNVVRLTNRGEWNISAVDLQRKFNVVQVNLVNDFVANGYV